MRVTTAIVAVLLLAGLSSAAPLRAQTPARYSVTMFHYNIQYVAGGLRGFPSGEDALPEFDYDADEVEDLIVRESFEPILDLFLAHPGWGVDLEMQAYMVEVLRDRHPDVLEKLRLLVQAGQAELISFHWADQLFLAYPRRAMERSHELMEEVWADVGIWPSPVVFCQEGQFGMGMARFARERGRAVLVLPKNLFRFQHRDRYQRSAPLYTLDGVDVILGGTGYSGTELAVSWSFFDDGELLATNDLNPYLGDAFRHDPESVATYELRLENLEAEGWRIATVGEYVAAAKAIGVRQDPLPPVLDGTWQPGSTNSMHKWMGLAGIFHLGYGNERDNAVLTGNVRAHHALVLAETMLDHAADHGLIDPSGPRARLRDCWREALLAQVSDATGINPWLAEVRYGLEHGAAARKCAEAVQAELGRAIGGPVVYVDSGSGRLQAVERVPEEELVLEPPLLSAADGYALEADGRQIGTAWHRLADRPNIHRLTIVFSPAQGSDFHLEARFPQRLPGFYLRPALDQGPAQLYPFSAFDLEEERITLPLANGLVGIDQDLWLIKETRHVHVGAGFEPEQGRLIFADWTADPAQEITWRFWLVEGGETEASALAASLNEHPVRWIIVEPEPDCGCAASDRASLAGWGLALLIGVGLLRRRYRSV